MRSILMKRIPSHLGLGLTICTISMTTQFTQADDPPVREFRYALIHIPGLGGGADRTVALNDSGHVVGWSYLSTGKERPILWDGSSTIDLGTFGGNRGKAYDINNDGVIVGRAQDDQGSYSPFKYQNEAMIDLGDGIFWSGHAYTINDAGQIGGQAHYIDGPCCRPILWDDNRVIDLPTPNDVAGEILAINMKGEAVGNFEGVNGFDHAAAWIGGQFVALENFPYVSPRGVVLGLNDQSIAVGQSYTVHSFRASIWNDSHRIQNLSRQENSIGGRIPWAWSINNLNQIVGAFYGRKDEELHGYVYSEENGAEALELLIPPHTGWRIEDGRDINNRGQITGSGFFTDDPNRYARGFLLTPVEPEMELSFADGPLIAGEYNTLTITNAMPSATIKFFYGKKGGGKFIPGCDALDAIMQINDPVLFGEAVADADGNATLRIFVPAKLQDEKGFLIQAADFDNCNESQLVLKQVE